ncbi:Alpha/Beta hydrolase protein [Infundibulicybe gibba]|nr:Alpha/Beta hydrolase protein [Infundibulicybe gibba]
MSDLYRSAMTARLARIPTNVALNEEDEDGEGEAADSIGVLPGSGMGPPAMQVRADLIILCTPKRNPTKPKREPNPLYSPISASSFFADAAQVAIPGRGLDTRVYYTPPKFSDGTVMICHHGAGYSGLSFACFAKEVADLTHGECGVLALDARRHGKTKSGDNDQNLSIDVLVADFYEVIQAVFPDHKVAPTLLVSKPSPGYHCPGLSLLLEQKYRVAGVAVLDVVEGSAIEALPHMHRFNSLEDAIEWHVTTNTIRNPHSARISIPAIMKQSDSADDVLPYRWRTPLRSTAPYWSSWFTGLSSHFLAARTARLLVLAGTDRLDKELMIGQMQGKFQMEVVPGVGHMLQEDDPTRLAEILVDFWRRNERVVTGIKRVGDL